MFLIVLICIGKKKKKKKKIQHTKKEKKKKSPLKGSNGATVITTHTPISAQSSNSAVFKLQRVYFLSTSL